VSLYRRGKSWYYDFRYRGERYTGCIGPVSRTIAKEILAKKKAEAVEGRYEMPSKKPSPRLEDFIKEYFDYYRANRRPRSVTRHEVSWNAIRPVLGSKRLAEISPFDLERYRRQRKQDGMSDATINRELAFLRNLYTMAMTWGKATENPVKKVRFARENNERIRFCVKSAGTSFQPTGYPCQCSGRCSWAQMSGAPVHRRELRGAYPMRPASMIRRTEVHDPLLRATTARNRCVLGELGGPKGLNCGRAGAKMLSNYLYARYSRSHDLPAEASRTGALRGLNAWFGSTMAM
jgi:hypothetical protein